MKMMEESEREAREMYESADPATVEHWDIAEEEKKETPFGPPSFARSVGELRNRLCQGKFVGDRDSDREEEFWAGSDE
ncbi:hypothetical protein BLNAU_8102 [Blattamonas nauphoetae]|uniref:Uncharacterized protein n=1 Tax=Blattamonas nauphoetae TaxID=2049346 RepID=A0ABQ9XZX2_9EUKA|nr:hypothetical protein BLNAU_8102 [Blattamonas nauphoetae]